MTGHPRRINELGSQICPVWSLSSHSLPVRNFIEAITSLQFSAIFSNGHLDLGQPGCVDTAIMKSLVDVCALRNSQGNPVLSNTEPLKAVI
jgi:hypothetical protein